MSIIEGPPQLVEAQPRSFESSLRGGNVLSPGEILVGHTQVGEFRGGEGWSYAYDLSVKGVEGTVGHRLVLEKNMISMGGGLQQRAENELSAFLRLREQGIVVPQVYGAYKAAVYREFIPEDTSKEVIWGVKKGDISDPQKRGHLDQLIDMAEKLDRFGYSALGFTHDIVFDPRGGKFVLIDPGFDLGAATGNPTNSSYRHINGLFSHHTDYIDQRYNELRNATRPAIAA